jgi:hypothetical protein
MVHGVSLFSPVSWRWHVGAGRDPTPSAAIIDSQSIRTHLHEGVYTRAGQSVLHLMENLPIAPPDLHCRDVLLIVEDMHRPKDQGIGCLNRRPTDSGVG